MGRGIILTTVNYCLLDVGIKVLGILYRASKVKGLVSKVQTWPCVEWLDQERTKVLDDSLSFNASGKGGTLGINFIALGIEE